MRMRKEVFILNIDDILPNRFQPRIKFDEKAILELSESIKKHGVIQPIIVRKIADKYEIIAGERRYKASIIAGRKTIPAIITDVDDKESAEIALIENVQRQNMTPIEEAVSYKKILDMGYLNQSELAIKLGKTQSTIANKLRLLNLSDDVQEALLNEKISERHARSLLKLPVKDQSEVLKKIINERLTVRKTDQLINNILNPNTKEEKGEIMNNNFENINNNFNIPSEPIIENNVAAPSSQEVSNPTPQPEVQPFNPFINIPNDDSEQGGVPQNTIFNPFNIGGPVNQPEPQGFNPFTAPQPESNPVNMNGPEPVSVQEPQGFNPFAAPQPESNPVNMNGPEPVGVQEPQGFNPFAAPQPESNPVNMNGPEPVGVQEPQGFNPFAAPQPESNPVNMNGPEPVSVQEPQGFNPFAAPQPESNPVNMNGPEPVGVQEPQGFNPFAAPQPESNPFNMNGPEPVGVQEPQGFNPFAAPQPESNPFNMNQSMPEMNSTPFVSTPNYPLPETQELTPLMPEVENQMNRVDLNQIINKIRSCISEVERMGYKVDSDELDLQNTYEFTIKIDKI